MPAATAADVAIQFALRQVGKRYVWGGNGPDGFDCSGLMQQAYKSAGVKIPRVARDQATVGKAVTIENAVPGDLVFPYVDYRHVAMYLGNGQIVEAAQAGVPIHVVKLYASAGGVRRIVDGGGAAVGPIASEGVTGGVERPTPALGVLQMLQTVSSTGSWVSIGLLLAGIVLLGFVAIDVAASEGLI